MSRYVIPAAGERVFDVMAFRRLEVVLPANGNPGRLVAEYAMTDATGSTGPASFFAITSDNLIQDLSSNPMLAQLVAAVEHGLRPFAEAKASDLFPDSPALL